MAPESGMTRERAGVCPFCGGPAEPEPVPVRGGFYVTCSDCDESGPIEPTVAAAIAGWNRGHFDPREGAV